MTDDSKQLLLDYFMGFAPSELPNDKQIINYKSTINASIYKDYIPKNTTAINIEDIIQAPQNISDISIAYGGYKVGNESYGWILLLDSEFKPIKSFFEYDSGTKLRYIDCMYIDDNGDIYAVDDNAYSPGENGQMTSEKRFLYLNNFLFKMSSGDYVIRLNKAYRLIDNNIYCHNIMKSPNSSSFVFGGGRYDKDNGQQTSSIIISLKVKVGEENEWEVWPTSGKKYRYGGFYATWDEDNNVNFNALYTVYENNHTTIYLCWNVGNGYGVKEIRTLDLQRGIILQNLQRQVVFFSKEKFCFVITNSPYVSEQCVTYIYKYENEALSVLYSNSIDYITPYQEQVYLFNESGNFYALKSLTKEDKREFYVCNDTLEWVELYTYNGISSYFVKPIICRKYNLLTYFFCNTILGIPTIAKEINNLNGYNGDTYLDANSLIPTGTVLYRESDPIFARSLYNKGINGNTTTSVVEIPNIYLNNIIVNRNDLLSKTNSNIISDNSSFEKNIYETVYLNFINTIGIATRDDDGSSINYTLNQEASNILNNSINNPIDYDAVKFTKARIKYQDGTYEIIRTQRDKIIKGHYQAIITFNVPKTVENVEWISENEEYIYSTIDVSSCIVGRTYTLKQTIRKGSDINGANYL